MVAEMTGSADDRELKTRSWDSFQRMRVLLASQIGRELSRRAGLSEAEFEILNVLSEAEGGTLRALALRCGLDWEKSRLSHQLLRMEKRGLIRREHCKEDGRSTVIRLTGAGIEAFAAAKSVHDEALNRYFGDVLTCEQFEALEAIAARIVARLTQDTEPNHRALEAAD